VEDSGLHPPGDAGHGALREFSEITPQAGPLRVSLVGPTAWSTDSAISITTTGRRSRPKNIHLLGHVGADDRLVSVATSSSISPSADRKRRGPRGANALISSAPTCGPQSGNLHVLAPEQHPAGQREWVTTPPAPGSRSAPEASMIQLPRVRLSNHGPTVGALEVRKGPWTCR